VICLVDHFASCFVDRRVPQLVEHGVRTLIGQRAFGIALSLEKTSTTMTKLRT
jgi:hypothetical protein